MKIHLQISIVPGTCTDTKSTHRAFAACFCSLALILTSALHAQTPTPCPDHHPPQTAATALDAMFQPSHYDPNDTTVMYHIKFKPSGTGPWPTVLMLPPDVFKIEIKAAGTTKERVATRDLTDNGFLVFQIEHRLAPDGLLEGQHEHDTTLAGVASGRPPQQSDDVKQQILAALADTDCNGKIFLIGGSAGACLAVWVALDPTAENVTDWGADVVAKIKGVVGLSGVYDLPLRNPTPPPNFISDVNNYTNTTDPLNLVQWEAEYAASPISLVLPYATNQTAPIRLYATDGDSIPPVQSEEMRDALLDKGVDVVFYEITNSSLHAFNYWHAINTNTGECVSTEVINFLNAHR